MINRHAYVSKSKRNTKKLTIDKVKKLVLQSMTTNDRFNMVFYIDETIYPEGKELVIGKNKYHVAFDTIMVFVDEEPGKNWAHNCRYLFFDVHTGNVKEVHERFPPSLTKLPPTFQVIWKPEGIPSFALLGEGESKRRKKGR